MSSKYTDIFEDGDVSYRGPIGAPGISGHTLKPVNENDLATINAKQGLGRLIDIVGEHIAKVEAPLLTQMMSEIDHLSKIAKTQRLLADD